MTAAAQQAERSPGGPWVLRAPGGLRAVLADGGAPVSLATGDLELIQHAASAFEPALLQVWVRDRAAGRAWPVLGAGSGGRVAVGDGAVTVAGDTGAPAGLSWAVTLTLEGGRPAWAWHVEVANHGPDERVVDVVHAHDVALAAPGALRTNELYVSQYLDLTPLDGGTALAVRQNLPQAGAHPWCVLTATTPVVAWATDALDVYGCAARTGAPAPVEDRDLPSRRLQHEHTLAALQTEAVRLAPGARLQTSFGGLVLPNHPGATSPADRAAAQEARRLAGAAAPWATGGPPVDGPPVDGPPVGAGATPPAPRAAPAGPGGRPSAPVAAPTGAYDPGRTARTRPLSPAELETRWPGPWLVPEQDEDERMLSFFTGAGEHVVTQAKEAMVLRPHGTILRTGGTLAPDPQEHTVTAWMTGSPLSYLTRGHASAAPALSTVRGYLGRHRAYGLRVFVEVEGGWRLLDLPSAFAMTPEAAHWVYALAPPPGAAAGTGSPGIIELRTRAPADHPQVELEVTVTGGPARRVLLAVHTAADHGAAAPVGVEPVPGGVILHGGRPDGPGPVEVGVRSAAPVIPGDDGPLFDDGRSRDASCVTLRTGPLTQLALTVRVLLAAGAPGGPPSGAKAPAPSSPTVAHSRATDPLAVSLPWLVRDALVHYLTPRGLEQFTGGAWGTRDVTQGPVELLLALDRLPELRALLLRIFAAQNTDGSWPQAFGFLPGSEHARHEPPHGDVVHWPVLALGRYLLASHDAGILTETVPWYTPPGAAATAAPVREHLARALAHARAGMLPGTALVAYGHGDWNDSLQPADPAMAATMTSSWTVTLHHQALTAVADGLQAAGTEPGLVTALREEAAAVAADLRRHLVVDGELAGYGLLGAGPGGPTVHRVLVHPRDTETGLRHGSLQMIHALGADLLDAEQARRHVALVREHLTGVDGVRLFDRPPGYYGGVTQHFQRAETATFVGREIGLMYVHAHLRWCEAMARWGDAEALWLGLRQSLAPGVVDLVPGARRRQANTYASSSDAACLDRADFAARYPQVLTGATGLEAGWRIYSSGPGVLVRIVTQSFLGVRRRGPVVHVDPVLPAALDGLRASVPLAGGRLALRYRVGPTGHGPTRVALAGEPLPATRQTNPYRPGGLAVDLAALDAALRPGGPELEVQLP